MSENTLPAIRNEAGLLTNVQYIYSEDGRIDWRKMVPNKYLYPNPQFADAILKKHNKLPSQVPVTELEDAHLTINLAGIKYLAYLRGYTSVSTTVNTNTPEYASVTTHIEFIPNAETAGKHVTFGDSGCAHPNNTKGFGNYYLVEIATNRAFCRAVRNFLGINLVSSEELGSKEQIVDTQTTSPTSTLRAKAKEVGKNLGFKSYQDIVKAFQSAGITVELWSTFNKIDEIPDDKMFFFVDNLTTYKTKLNG